MRELGHLIMTDFEQVSQKKSAISGMRIPVSSDLCTSMFIEGELKTYLYC